MADVTLLLVGKDGNGKSSIGNSILRRKEFTARSSSSKGSYSLVQGSTQVGGKKVTVVDGISVRDDCTDGPENVSGIISQAQNAVLMVPNGFTAFVVVLKYGVRFTNQEKQAIRIIKSLFGNDVLKKYGVVVMSYGDSFASDVEDDGTTFDGWCRQQKGDVKDLFEECGNRYVLFNNREQKTEPIEEQIQNLMSAVEKIQLTVPSYDITSFEKAKPGRNKLLVQSKLPQLEKETETVLDSITRRLRKLDDNTPDECLKIVDELEAKIQSHKAHLQEVDQETNSIGQLLVQISVMEASLSTKKQRYLLNKEIERNKPPPPPSSSSPSPLPGFVIVLICIGGVVLAYVAYNSFLWGKKQLFNPAD